MSYPRTPKLVISALALILPCLLLSACGGGGGDGGGSDGNTPQPQPQPPTAGITLLAGNIGGSGNLDGEGTDARFNGPRGIAVDKQGNVYIADRANFVIRKITAAGTVSTLAGTKGALGSPGDFGINDLNGMAVDSAGNIYVAINQVIRKITPQGAVSTLAGEAGVAGHNDGVGTRAHFDRPSSIAIDASDNIYVADNSNHTVRKISPDGTVSTLAGLPDTAGYTDGIGMAARFFEPNALAFDRNGVLFVVCGDGSIRKITAGGVVSTVVGRNPAYDAVPAVHRSLVVDADGNFLLTRDTENRIQKITPAGATSIFAGGQSDNAGGRADGHADQARFSTPQGLAIDGAGNLLVVDFGNHTVRKITPQLVVSTWAGMARQSGGADGNGAAARFNRPAALMSDADRNIYVAEIRDSTIRKISRSGDVTTFAGVAGSEGATDGQGSAARFKRPYDIDIDATGNLYVADSGNAAIRKISPGGLVSTVFVSTLAPKGNGPTPENTYHGPGGLEVDSVGNIYFADYYHAEVNTSSALIRKIAPSGNVTTVAGRQGGYGNVDGIGSAATFRVPGEMVSDQAGNLYVLDEYNGNIRKISSTGVVSTLAGNTGEQGIPLDTLPPGSEDGIGSQAGFNFPSSITMDETGNLYVADAGNHVIRKITPSGVVSTVAGTPGQRGNRIGPLPGKLDSPIGIHYLGERRFAVSSGAAILILTLP
ncbi:NHL domain-containing protein [Chitinimonas arctica]|uniref:NHL domain-containing protein n=1 Tax=Chitinimonas arctica TaxID=2594795 RepID=UPI0015D2A5F3|nr:hypothetical protein [Chitinimonas arctica]